MAVSQFKELRHGINVLPKEDGKEKDRDNNKRSSSNKFIGSDTQPDSKPRSGHTDKLFGRYIGCDNRRTDSPPTQTVSGKKIVLRILFSPFFTAGKQPDSHNQAYATKTT